MNTPFEELSEEEKESERKVVDEFGLLKVFAEYEKELLSDINHPNKLP